MEEIQPVMYGDNAADLEQLRAAAKDYIKQRGDVVCFSSYEKVLRFSENNGVAMHLLEWAAR